MRLLAAAAILVLASGCSRGISEVSPNDLVTKARALDDTFVRTCGYVTTANGTCRLRVCPAGTAPSRMAECAPIAEINLSSSSADCDLDAQLHADFWALVDGYPTALEARDGLTEQVVLRKAVIQRLPGTCEGRNGT